MEERELEMESSFVLHSTSQIEPLYNSNREGIFGSSRENGIAEVMVT